MVTWYIPLLKFSSSACLFNVWGGIPEMYLNFKKILEFYQPTEKIPTKWLCNKRFF